MQSYLEKNARYPAFISKPPSAQLGIIVVIPCYDETELLRSLTSLQEAEAPKSTVEVITVINDSEMDVESVRMQNQKTLMEAEAWAKTAERENLRFHFIYAQQLPKKKAGVGLARKIGMDEAVRRFTSLGKERGIIACFDADSLCEKNYFLALEDYFSQHLKMQALSINYAHPIEGEKYPASIYTAIIQYELHLRYFTLAKRFARYPYAYETIGSSMAVRVDAYQQQGGMNMRKAGEDFYFLNKFMLIDTLGELNTTTLIPSPRISHRVPFGTGKAVGELLQKDRLAETYSPRTFLDLKQLMISVPSFFSMTETELDVWLEEQEESVRQFLTQQNFKSKVIEIQQHTNQLPTFKARFFRWFDPFMVMKCCHFFRDHFYPNVAVEEATAWLLTEALGKNPGDFPNAIDQLRLLRTYWA